MNSWQIFNSFSPDCGILLSPGASVISHLKPVLNYIKLNVVKRRNKSHRRCEYWKDIWFSESETSASSRRYRWLVRVQWKQAVRNVISIISFLLLCWATRILRMPRECSTGSRSKCCLKLSRARKNISCQANSFSFVETGGAKFLKVFKQMRFLFSHTSQHRKRW